MLQKCKFHPLQIESKLPLSSILSDVTMVSLSQTHGNTKRFRKRYFHKLVLGQVHQNRAFLSRPQSTKFKTGESYGVSVLTITSSPQTSREAGGAGRMDASLIQVEFQTDRSLFLRTGPWSEVAQPLPF